jgi:hypothetical protein
MTETETVDTRVYVCDCEAEYFNLLHEDKEFWEFQCVTCGVTFRVRKERKE